VVETASAAAVEAALAGVGVAAVVMVVAALAVGAKGMDSTAVAAQEAVGEVTVDSVVERLEMVEAHLVVAVHLEKVAAWEVGVAFGERPVAPSEASRAMEK
jgi:hypothetical protein